MSGLTELPSTSESSLGSTRKDLIPFRGELHRASAGLLNKIRTYLIQMGEMLGLEDGSTPGSLRAQVNTLMEGGGGGGGDAQLVADLDYGSSADEANITFADLVPVTIPMAPPFMGYHLPKNQVVRYDFAGDNEDTLFVFVLPEGEDGDVVCLAQEKNGRMSNPNIWYIASLSGQTVEGSAAQAFGPLTYSPYLEEDGAAFQSHVTYTYRGGTWRLAKAELLGSGVELGGARWIAGTRVDQETSATVGQVLKVITPAGEGAPATCAFVDAEGTGPTYSTFESNGTIRDTDAVVHARASDGSIELTLPAIPATDATPRQIDLYVTTSTFCTVTLRRLDGVGSINAHPSDLVITDSTDRRLYRAVTTIDGWVIILVGSFTP